MVLAASRPVASLSRCRATTFICKWSTIKRVLSTHTRSTVVLQGEGGVVHYVRVSGQPEGEHLDIYRKLRVKDPLKTKQFTLIKECST